MTLQKYFFPNLSLGTTALFLSKASHTGLLLTKLFEKC